MSTRKARLNRISERLPQLDRSQLEAIKSKLEDLITTLQSVIKTRIKAIGSIRNNSFAKEKTGMLIGAKNVLNEVVVELQVRNMSNSSENEQPQNNDPELRKLLNTIQSEIALESKGGSKKRQSTRKRRNRRK